MGESREKLMVLGSAAVVGVVGGLTTVLLLFGLG